MNPKNRLARRNDVDLPSSETPFIKRVKIKLGYLIFYAMSEADRSGEAKTDAHSEFKCARSRAWKFDFATHLEAAKEPPGNFLSLRAALLAARSCLDLFSKLLSPIPPRISSNLAQMLEPPLCVVSVQDVSESCQLAISLHTELEALRCLFTDECRCHLVSERRVGQRL